MSRDQKSSMTYIHETWQVLP